MNAHTKQQQDKVFETDFIDSQKSYPPFAHLLALSHIYYDFFFQAKVDGESDVTKLHQLFKITQAVMVNRHNMVEESMAEAEEEAKKAKKKGELFKVG